MVFIPIWQCIIVYNIYTICKQHFRDIQIKTILITSDFSKDFFHELTNISIKNISTTFTINTKLFYSVVKRYFSYSLLDP